jgi:hypothetical protein
MTKGMVGIYFKIGTDWLVDAVAVLSGEPYGEAIQHGEHYSFWDAFRPGSPAEYRFKRHAYDYYPRGRIVYFPQKGVYRIYLDPCLTAEDLSAIIARFDLEGHPREVVDDRHYRCSRCNPHYLD